MGSTQLRQCERVVVLDPGLAQVGDHSYAIARGLGRIFGGVRAVPLTLYSAKDFEQGLDRDIALTPHFRHSLYSDIPASRATMAFRHLAARLAGRPVDMSPSERRTNQSLNSSFEDDLARLPSCVWARGTIVLLPGLFHHQILGLANFIRMNSSRIEANIVCQLMFGVTWLPWGKQSKLGARTYHDAFKALKPLIGSTIVFTAENGLVAETYRRDFDIDLPMLPVPLRGKRSSPRNGGIRIGYFGYSKREKGFHLLPAAIAQCQEVRDDLSFVVQVQHDGHEPQTVAADHALRQMHGIRLLDGALQEEAFATESASVDVVLLPYDPTLFGVRGSGIFTEAATAGRLIVASRYIWAGRSIESGEAIGETFEPHNSSALAQAILRLCGDFDRKSQLALELAPSFASVYSMSNYVHRVFDIAKMRHPTEA